MEKAKYNENNLSSVSYNEDIVNPNILLYEYGKVSVKSGHFVSIIMFKFLRICSYFMLKQYNIQKNLKKMNTKLGDSFILQPSKTK